MKEQRKDYELDDVTFGELKFETASGAHSSAMNPAEIMPADSTATAKQVQANRENAKSSTGPKTLAGKTAVRHNAVRHGLTAQTLLAGEEEHFAELRQQITDYFQPVNGFEEMLVELIVIQYLRFIRSKRAERDLFGTPNPGQTHSIGDLFMEEVPEAKAFERLGKYEAQVEKSLFKTIHELQRIQAARSGQVVPPPLAVDLHTA